VDVAEFHPWGVEQRVSCLRGPGPWRASFLTRAGGVAAGHGSSWMSVHPDLCRGVYLTLVGSNGSAAFVFVNTLTPAIVSSDKAP
jgi:hypothetical protein